MWVTGRALFTDHMKDWMIYLKSCFPSERRIPDGRVLEKLWNSSFFFSFFWKYDQVWAFNAFSRKTSVCFMCSVNHFFFFQRSIFGTKWNKRKKRVFRRHLGKSHSIGYHGTRQVYRDPIHSRRTFFKNERNISINYDWILCFVISKGHNSFHCEVSMIQLAAFLPN